MKKIFISLFILSSPSFARIGETIEECKSRYGKPTQIKGDQIDFKKGGIDITVNFFEGKAIIIKYSGRITSGMAEELQKANGGDRQWKVTTNDPSVILSQTTDKDLESTFAYGIRNSPEDHLIIMSRPSLRKQSEAKAAEDKKRIEGL